MQKSVNNGVAMGSALRPTFTNIFLCVHEILWLEKSPPEFRLVMYKRYVDDTFLLFRNISQIEKFKYYLNFQHANNNNNVMLCYLIIMLSFLDIKIV